MLCRRVRQANEIRLMGVCVRVRARVQALSVRVTRKGLSDKVTFKKRPEGKRRGEPGRSLWEEQSFQDDGSTSVKAPRVQHVYCLHGRARRPLWLE